MAKKKQEAKLKEPVRIRFKQLANGNQSIYLDYCTGDVIRKENYVGGNGITKYFCKILHLGSSFLDRSEYTSRPAAAGLDVFWGRI